MYYGIPCSSSYLTYYLTYKQYQVKNLLIQNKDSWALDSDDYYYRILDISTMFIQNDTNDNVQKRLNTISFL